METFNFTPEFQNLILACLVRHPEKFTRYGQILNPRHFIGSHATLLARLALEYNTQRSRFPTFPVLEQLALDEMHSEGQDERGGELSEYVRQLTELDTADVEHVTDRVVMFAKERATLAAIRQSIEDIKAGTVPEAGLVKRFEDVLKIGQDLEDMGYILHVDAERVIRKITENRYGIRTGFYQLDQIWKNGWAPGWLVSFLAPPKRWKTTMALNLALNMIGPTIGEDVIYYTCEISQEFALAKCLYNLSMQSSTELYETTETFIQRAIASIQQQVAGNLLVKGYASKTATISMMKIHAKTAIQQLGIRPKAIIIDYAETVRPSDKNQSEHEQAASIFTEARAMGHELGCVVVMPDRCNRETVSLTVPNMKSFQGAFQKSGIVDVAIGLCATDAEYLNNIVRWFVFLNRYGSAYQHIRGKVDPERSRLEMIEEIPYEPEDASPSRRRDGPASTLPNELQE